MGSTKVSALVYAVAISFLGQPSAMAQSTAPDLIAPYQILQSRSLALTFTNGYFLQDGQILLPGQVNRFRVHCQADRGTFDDAFGAVEIYFSTTTAGASRALLKTIPDTAKSQSTRIECLSGSPIRGLLDLQVALGRVVEVTR